MTKENKLKNITDLDSFIGSLFSLKNWENIIKIGTNNPVTILEWAPVPSKV